MCEAKWDEQERGARIEREGKDKEGTASRTQILPQRGLIEGGIQEQGVQRKQGECLDEPLGA